MKRLLDYVVVVARKRICRHTLRDIKDPIPLDMERYYTILFQFCIFPIRVVKTLLTSTANMTIINLENRPKVAFITSGIPLN